MKWIFLFACSTFTCHGDRPLPGDGAYRDTRTACVSAARDFARSRHINLHRWELVCALREPPQ